MPPTQPSPVTDVLPPSATAAGAEALGHVQLADAPPSNTPPEGMSTAPAEEEIPAHVGGEVQVPVMAAADSPAADSFFAPQAPPPPPAQPFAETPPAPPYPQPTFDGAPMAPVGGNQVETPTQPAPIMNATPPVNRPLVEVPKPNADISPTLGTRQEGGQFPDSAEKTALGELNLTPESIYENPFDGFSVLFKKRASGETLSKNEQALLQFALSRLEQELRDAA